MLTKDIIDWEETFDRDWLERELFNDFTEEEKESIITINLETPPNPYYPETEQYQRGECKAFPLSIQEFESYSQTIPGVKNPEITENAKKHAEWKGTKEKRSFTWALRTSGQSGRFVSMVRGGELSASGLVSAIETGTGRYREAYYGARPAIWIDIYGGMN